MSRNPEEYHADIEKIAPKITEKSHITDLTFLPVQVAFLLMRKHQVSSVGDLVKFQEEVDLNQVVGIGPVSISSLDYFFMLRPDLLGK